MSRIETDVALAERQVAASLEKGADLSEMPNLLFAMVDFDGLKEVNDSYGHEAGDLALLQMTRLLEEFRRKSDSLVRWGGDEFLIVGRNLERVGGAGLQTIEYHRRTTKILAQNRDVAIARLVDT